MNPNEQKLSKVERLSNKTFYRFLFHFIMVVAGVLLFILVVGSAGGAV